MNNKIAIVSVKNELSGSCIAISRLSKLLIENNYDTKFYTSEGAVLSGYTKLQNTSLNIFKVIINIIKLNKNINKDSFIIFNTILSLPYYLLSFNHNKVLYIHEQNLKPNFLYKIINFLINIFKVKVAVVNPIMLNKYNNSFLLQNYINIYIHEISIIKKKQILMISNCNFTKGIKDLFILAKRYNKYKFVLLTNKDLAKDECLEYLESINIDNLIIYFDQSLKSKLIEESKYLLSMSYYNETFGLVLSEAIQNNTIPISISNDGSNYCLNYNKSLIFTRSYVFNNFSSIINHIDKNHLVLLKTIKQYIGEEFNKHKIIFNLNKIMKEDT